MVAYGIRGRTAITWQDTRGGDTGVATCDGVDETLPSLGQANKERRGGREVSKRILGRSSRIQKYGGVESAPNPSARNAE